jgi:hypothetical protein
MPLLDRHAFALFKPNSPGNIGAAMTAADVGVAIGSGTHVARESGDVMRRGYNLLGTHYEKRT